MYMHVYHVHVADCMMLVITIHADVHTFCLDGRSKSKITVDGKCKLLLIREETGKPSKQLCQWADVLLLVFSYSDDDSLAQVGRLFVIVWANVGIVYLEVVTSECWRCRLRV